MELICDPKICTGCSACANLCPKGCIEMKEGDSLGHIHPFIDQKSCIDCGVCKKVCPALHPLSLIEPKTAYAGLDKCEAEYLSSTSGGAASAMSRAIIRGGGVVYGCSMLEGVDVQHIRVESEDELYKLKGSKYVQSNIKFCFRDIKNDLLKGIDVLFIGTPCQVAGLKSFLNKEYINLYTSDLICHGIPPQAFFKRHINKITRGVIPDEIIFRKGTYLLSLVKGGKEIYCSTLFKERYRDIYYNTFFDGYTYRDSCYTCIYACPRRVSDITIGDFWGLKTELPVNHDNGCSVLLPNTIKGNKLIKLISSDFYLFERLISEAVNGNAQLKYPVHQDFRIKIFRKICPFIGISTSYKICVLDHIFKRKISNLLKSK